MRIHRRGKEALALHRLKWQDRTDDLVRTLHEIVLAYRVEGAPEERIAALDAVLTSRSAEVLAQCEAHESHAGNNYYPFLWRFYASHRPTLFLIWRAVTLHTTSQDASLERALQFVLDHEQSRSEWLPIPRPKDRTALDLSWVSDSWWRLVTGQRPTQRGAGTSASPAF